MHLRDLMRTHHRALLNRGHFAHRGDFTPEGAEKSFPVTMAIGDVADTVVDLAGGRGQSWQISATAALTDLVNGIATCLDEERQPVLGDTWTLTDGEYAGVWKVMGMTPDEGGLAVLTLKYERPITVAGKGTAAAGGG